MRLLLVEDDVMVASGIKLGLCDAGYAVDWVGSAERALEARRRRDDGHAEVPRERLISDMVGRELQDIYDYRTRQQGPIRLEARSLHSARLPEPLSFSVRGGEVLGFFGLVGAGLHNRHRILPEIGQLQITQNTAAVRAGDGTHAPLTGRRERG